MSRDEYEPKPRDRRPYKVVHSDVALRVQKHAQESLAAPKRLTTNLYIDQRELRRGDRIGPEFEQLVLEQPTVLVFADEAPTANFAHDCNYLLYDAHGRPLRQIEAKFPPYDLLPGGTLRPFYQPVPVAPQTISGPKPPAPPCPAIPSVGRRYAVLFAGACEVHHVNDLELFYRTLTLRYQFAPEDVFVLVHNGRKEASGGMFSDGMGALRRFPVDNSLFQIEPFGAGTRAKMREVFEKLSDVIQPQDLLFVHTNGHGGNSLLGTFVGTYAPTGTGRYMTTDLADDLQLFKDKNKPYRALLAMMQQCHSGGFEQTVLNGSNATETSACWAAAPTEWSWWSYDRNFTQFGLSWITAQRTQLLNGTPVPSDKNDDGTVEASEAFSYAYQNRHPEDSPSEANQNGGQNIAFGTPTPVDAQWCEIVSPVMAEYWRDLSEPEFYERLHRALPRLRAEVLPLIEANARSLKKELSPTVQRILAEAFGKKRPRVAARGGTDRSRGQAVRARRR